MRVSKPPPHLLLLPLSSPLLNLGRAPTSFQACALAVLFVVCGLVGVVRPII